MSDSTPTAVREISFNDGSEHGWVRIPLLGTAGDVQFSDLARFQPKMLFGDPSKDDNDLLSSWQIDNLSGGHGVHKLKEGTDQGRYRFGTMITRFPGQISRGYYVEDPQTFVGAGTYEVLGDMYAATHDTYVLIVRVGTTIWKCVADHGTITQATTSEVPVVSATGLTNVPVARGTAFCGSLSGSNDWFFIPQGNNGYAYLHESTAVVNQFATPKFRAFATWDNKLVGVTTGGRLYWTLDGTTWTAYDLTYALPHQFYIRDLIRFYDRRDEPALFVLTESEMYQFDPDGPELFPIDFEWPSKGRRVQAACVWQGQLFIAVGMGVYRYTSGTWMAVGLDRDEGLPIEYRGYIADMQAGLNGVYALVRGENHNSIYGAKSSVHEFSGSGWQCLWTQDNTQTPNQAPTNEQYHGALADTAKPVKRIVVTRAHMASQDHAYGLVWDMGTSGVTGMDLGDDFTNPRAAVQQQAQLGIGRYYFLETGAFDADMFGYTKIANTIQFTLDDPKEVPDGAWTFETLRFLYRIDGGTWKILWTGNAVPGRYTAAFGDEIAIDSPAPGHPATSLRTGIPFESIEFRWELFGQPNFYGIIISNFVFSFLKTVSSNDSFQVTLDLRNGAVTDNGVLSPQELAAYIDNLTSVKHFCALGLGQYTYRVFVAQNGGNRATGGGLDTMRAISMVEIPTSL